MQAQGGLYNRGLLAGKVEEEPGRGVEIWSDDLELGGTTWRPEGTSRGRVFCKACVDLLRVPGISNRQASGVSADGAAVCGLTGTNEVGGS